MSIKGFIGVSVVPRYNSMQLVIIYIFSYATGWDVPFKTYYFVIVRPGRGASEVG